MEAIVTSLLVLVPDGTDDVPALAGIVTVYGCDLAVLGEIELNPWVVCPRAQPPNGGVKGRGCDLSTLRGNDNVVVVE
jgi:hypothetical protein